MRVQTEYIEVPESLHERIGNMAVAAGVMFVKNITFVLIVSKGVDFTTVKYVIRRLNTVLSNSIVKIF